MIREQGSVFRTETPRHEIHRPSFAGTPAMDQALFHTQDDASTLSRHFVDTDGLPFALVLPTLSPWALEGVSVEHLYPRLVGFASSGGTQNQDFYASGVDLSYAYGWSPSSQVRAPGDPAPVYSVSNWTPPNAPAFLGPKDIPADTGCVDAWGLSVQYGSSRDTYGYDSVVDGSSMIVTGYTRRSFAGTTNQGAEDIFVAKYNRQTGALIWSKLFGGSGSETGRSVAVDAAGNIYIAGETRSSFDSQPNAGAFDAFVMKLDSNGTRQWTRFLGGNHSDYGTGVAVDSSGAVFVGGGSASNNLPGASYPGNSPFSFLAKFDASGNRQWVQQVRTDPITTTGRRSGCADCVLGSLVGRLHLPPII